MKKLLLVGCCLSLMITAARSQSISAGGSFSLVICSDSSIVGSGWNHVGQLGDNTDTSQSFPVPTVGITNAIKIATGDEHGLAILADGTLMAWGNNNYGQLGNTAVDSFTTIPVPVMGLTDIVEIDAGEEHSIALRSDGTVWTWGANFFGQLGDGTTTDRNLPVQVSSLPPIKTIACGAYHSFAVDSMGDPWSWGYNNYGQLGNLSQVDQYTPDTLYKLHDVVRMGSGRYHSFAIKTDGTLWAWGHNNAGQLAQWWLSSHTSPTWINELSNVVAVDGGLEHSIALLSDSTVWSWGGNTNGQLGLGVIGTEYDPVQVPGISNATEIAAAHKFTMAKLVNSTVLVWGGGFHGQLGVGISGTGAKSLSPVPMAVYCLNYPNYLKPTPKFGETHGSTHWFFTDSSSNNPTSWLWDFGDGHTDTVQNPTHVYDTAGNYRVCLTATNSFGSKTYCKRFDVSCIPEVSFVAADTFLDLTLHQTAYGADSIYWDFGDGYGDTSSNPVHTYAADNNYLVCLTGTNTCGADTFCQVVTVGCAVEASFTHSSSYYGFDFFNQSTGATSWLWDFGDGNTSTLENPFHLYDTAGIYIVKLTASNYCNSDNFFRAVRVGMETSPMSANSQFTILSCNNGQLWAFGKNTYGGLGDSTTKNTTSPVAVKTNEPFVAIKGGFGHSLALHADGTVWGWGGNYEDQLGFATPNERIPHRNPHLDSVVAIATSKNSSLALRKDGTVWGWGYNFYHCVADTSLYSVDKPLKHEGLPFPIVAIDHGYRFSLALDNRGDVWAWGENHRGQLGQGHYGFRLYPVIVKNLPFIVGIAASDNRAYALAYDGTVWAWGYNTSSHYCGDTSNSTYTLSLPIQIPGITNAVAISARENVTLILDANGEVWSFGRNTYGQCGNGTWISPGLINKIPGLSGIVSISAGADHCIALDKYGDYYVWGKGQYGALGLSNNKNQKIPNLHPIGCSGTPLCPANSTLNFNYVVNQDAASFTDLSVNVQSIAWDFGDGHGSVDSTADHVYSDPGIYNVCLIGDNGICYDSLCTLIQIDAYVQQNLSICSGDSIFLENTWQTSAGYYVDTITTVQGYDSIVETFLTILPAYSDFDTILKQSGDSIFLAGSWQFTAGTYLDTFKTVHFCDSFIYTTVNFVAILTTGDTSICFGDSIWLANNWQKTNGVYYDTLISQLGLDSVVETNLSVQPVYQQYDSVQLYSGDSIFLEGQWQYNAGNYVDHLQTIMGCDSIVHTNVNMVFLQTSVDTAICFGDSIFLENFWQFNAGIFQDTLPSYLGFDSIVLTTLTVNPVYHQYDTLVMPAGDSIYFGGAWQKNDGTFTDPFQSINSCDSIIYTTVDFVFILTQIDSSICTGDSAWIGSAWRKTTGVYYDTLTSFQGFDSLVQITLSLLPTYYYHDTLMVQDGDSIYLAGAWQTVDGTYTDTYQTIQGCDSLISMTVSFISILVPVNASICSGDSMLLGGAYQTSAGVYYDTLVSHLGFDSVVQTTLSILPVHHHFDTLQVNGGDSIFIGGGWQTQDGNYTDTLQNSFQCDSIVTTTVYFIYLLTHKDTAICFADSILLGGAWQSEPGFYDDTLISHHGFDSVIRTALFLNPVYYTLDSVRLKPGDSVYVGGGWQSSPGLYLDSLHSIHQCDSIIQTYVTVDDVNGIDAGSTPFSMAIFPNPNHGLFQVRINNSVTAEWFIEVFDMPGQLIFRDRLTGSQSSFTLDLSDQPPGYYQLRIIGARGLFVHRPVIIIDQ